jgi:UTP--glucose-1-phosphate uridylyltransferase
LSKKIRAAVFPVAGRGTRFLPATKASPKEMLPIVDKPLIQYAVEEAIDAGATKLVFVTGSSKRAIEDHFDTDSELESALRDAGKDDLLRSIQGIVPPGVTCIYIRQGEPLGLGHAVLCARPAVGNEPFFVHLADDLIAGDPPCLTQMAAEHARHGGGVIAVETVPPEETSSYGIVAGGEIQLTDAIADLLDESPVYAYAFKGVRFDCGSKLGYLKATVAHGLEHPDTGEAFRKYLSEVVSG